MTHEAPGTCARGRIGAPLTAPQPLHSRSWPSRPPEAAPRRTKLVATLGPATDGLEHQLIAAGLDVARLNFSHGTIEEHAARCTAVRAAADVLGRPVAVMQDLQGPKIRVGRLAGGGPVQLAEGRTFRITTREVIGTAELVSCTYAGLPRDVHSGDRVLLDDGLLRITVTGIEGDTVVTRVEEGGPLGEHKGINLPGVPISASALTDKDRRDLAFGLRNLDVDYVALSFVRTAQEVRDARALMHKLGHETPLVVKLEKPEALDDLDAILEAADAVMVARGDLGVELSPEHVPGIQVQVIGEANRRGMPVIIATEMLQSMTTRTRPTRAEASDVAHAVWDGTDAVMLSGETAVGQHPLTVLQTMDRIVRAAEAVPRPPVPASIGEARSDVGDAAAVTHAACVLGELTRAVAIVGVTRTGRTAHLLSRERPDVPIYAFSSDARVCRRLALWWGVAPIHQALGPGDILSAERMTQHLLRTGVGRPGDRAVVVGVHDGDADEAIGVLAQQVLGEPE
jgi:pyruvate kinase